MNANQLGETIGVDYRTIRHHLDILEKNGMITSMGPRYGTMYFISPNLEDSWGDFEEIWNKIGTNPNNDGGQQGADEQETTGCGPHNGGLLRRECSGEHGSAGDQLGRDTIQIIER